MLLGVWTWVGTGWRDRAEAWLAGRFENERASALREGREARCRVATSDQGDDRIDRTMGPLSC